MSTPKKRHCKNHHVQACNRTMDGDLLAIVGIGVNGISREDLAQHWSMSLAPKVNDQR